jgi:1-aminocyclopropane-1-carboxylate deaminase/D-cysteine desulfhydrase-like pyridoxal-dependent ACC family enzyme
MPRSNWWKTSTTPTSNCKPWPQRLRNNGKKPYLVPIGGSNALGALGYVRAGLELAEQIKDTGLNFAAVVLASGSAGTHSGLALALSEALPDLPVIGVTVSRSEEDQRPKVQGLAERTAELLGVKLPASVQGAAVGRVLWRRVMASRMPGHWRRVKLVASQEGLLLDPVYTGKAMAGLLDGIGRQRLMKVRSSSCTPVGRRRCLPTSFFSNGIEDPQTCRSQLRQAAIFSKEHTYSFIE